MYIPSQESVYKRYFENLLPKRERLPDLIELIHNVNLVLVNSHPALHYPRPYVPNMIQIGGAHINQSISNDVLSPEILKFIDDATGGVIFMNLGTTRSLELSSEQIGAFLNVFSSYGPGIRVIWKLANASISHKFENVLIEPRLSQQAILGEQYTWHTVNEQSSLHYNGFLILAHSNVMLFVSQGCLFSIMEAINFATPMLSVPVFSDEHFHAALTEKHGVGIKLDANNLTETTIRNTIDQILSNAKYNENALRLSQLFNDNAIDPLTNAIYHIEYVLRTNGAVHYRSTVVDLSVWQQHLIDVTLIIIVGVALIIAVPSTIICIVLRKSNAGASKFDNKLTPKRSRRNSKKSKVL